MPKKVGPISNMEGGSINDLIIYCLNNAAKGRGVSFERLVKECFSAFPKVFGLSQYAKWPDSRKLDRPLRTLRKRGLVAGHPQIAFTLTASGRERALEISKIIHQQKLL